MRSPNHRPCPNWRIIVSPESSSTAVAAVHMGISYSESYSDKLGETEQTSDVKEMTRKFFPKHVVSAWLSISHSNGSIKRSISILFLLTCLIKRRLDVEILKIEALPRIPLAYRKANFASNTSKR